jgi:hypothetical protein
MRGKLLYGSIAIRAARAAAARARGLLAHDKRARGSLMHARARERATLRRIYYGGCMAEVPRKSLHAMRAC